MKRITTVFSLSLVAAAVQAQNCTVLKYTGAPFSVLTTTEPGYNQGIPLNGTVTLTNPLSPNLSNAAVTPASFDFSTVYPELTSAILNNAQPWQAASFAFSTDQNGNIIAWNVDLTYENGPGSENQSTGITTSTQGGDTFTSSSYIAGAPTNPILDYNTVASNAIGGTWACAIQPPDPLIAANASLQTKVNALTAQVTTMNTAATAANAKIAALNAEVASLQTQLAAATKSSPPVVGTPAPSPVVVAAVTPSKGSGGGSLSWAALVGLMFLVRKKAKGDIDDETA